MDRSRKTIVGAVLPIALAAAWLAHGAAQAGGQGARGAPQATTGYVGEETCLSCHQDQSKGYHDSAHGRASLPESPIAGRGCESCHGAGQAHVDASGDPSKILTFTSRTAARTINEQCLTCHTKGERALWNGSQHDALNVSCATCHSIHAPKSVAARLTAAREVETCERCHRAQVQKLSRTSHMPLKEGALGCSSCHNPHGTAGVKLLKVGTSVNETCQKCHAEKRGPFLWEHAPVAENCTTCHDAHGSTNDRMLVAKEPFLCQRCHVSSQHPPTVYDTYALTNSTTANRMYGRSCAACHQNVHGSNAPSGKAFLR